MEGQIAATQTTTENTQQPAAPQEGQQAQQAQVDWKASTGFESPDAIKEMATRYQSLEAELNEVKAKSSVSPFANPIIEEMNKLVASGRDIATLPKFLMLQGQDFDKMSSEDAIKWRQKMNMPRWSDADVNDWFDAEYPKFNADEDEDAIRKNRARDLRLDTIAENARKELNQMKVDAGKPDEAKQQQAQQQAQFREQLTGTVGTLINGMTKIAVSDELSGGKLEFDFVPQISEQERNTILGAVVQSHAGRGRLDEAGLQNVKRDVEAFTRMVLADKIRVASLKHLEAELTKNIAMQRSNVSRN